MMPPFLPRLKLRPAVLAAFFFPKGSTYSFKKSLKQCTGDRDEDLGERCLLVSSGGNKALPGGGFFLTSSLVCLGNAQFAVKFQK